MARMCRCEPPSDREQRTRRNNARPRTGCALMNVMPARGRRLRELTQMAVTSGLAALLLLSTEFSVADASAAYDPQPVSQQQHPEAGSWQSRGILTGAAAALGSLCILVIVVALCTDKEEQQGPDIEAVQRRESFVNMESNPYYSRGEVPNPIQEEEAQHKSPAVADEDELANLRMDAGNRRPRTTSVLLKQISLKETRTFIHHSTRRPEAEEHLQQHIRDTGESGVFLLRAKREDEGMYALDVGWKDDVSDSIYVTHHLLSRSQMGVYMVDEQVYDRLMSLEDVISYLSKRRNRALPGSLTTFIPSTDEVGDVPPQQIQSAA